MLRATEIQAPRAGAAVQALCRPLAAALALALAACGGGGAGDGDDGGGGGPPVDPPPAVALTGVVAVGQAVVGAQLAFAFQGSAPATVTSGAGGQWSASVLRTSLPCMVRASGGTLGTAAGAASTAVLHALLAPPAGSGSATARLNLSPLTELLAAAWAQREPAAAFDSPTAAQWATLTAPAIDSALAALRARLTPELAAALGSDNPLSVAFSADGSGHDAMLDTLAALIARAGTTLPALGTVMASGGSTPLIPAHLSGLSADTAAVGSSLTVTGYRLPASPVVRFGALTATATAATAGSVDVLVPAALVAGTAVPVSIDGVHGSFSFMPQAAAGGGGGGGGGGTLQPGLNPSHGVVGSTVTIVGSGFGSSPQVKFYDEFLIFGTLVRTEVAATVISASATEIVVSVPAGANSGPVTVNGASVGNYTVELPRVGAWTQQESAGGYSLATDGTRFVKVWSLANVKQGTDGVGWNDSFFYASVDYMGGQVQWDGSQFVYIVSKEATSSPVQTVAVSPDGSNWVTKAAGRKIISWDPQYASTVRDFIAVPGRITLVGDLGGIASSTDGGGSWSVESVPDVLQRASIVAVDDTGGERLAMASAADGGLVLRSVAGAAWTTIASGLDVKALDLLWTGTRHLAAGAAFASGGGARVLASADGLVWSATTLPATYASGDWRAARLVAHGSGLWLLVHRMTPANGPVVPVPNGAVLLRSTDGGLSWALDTDFGDDPVQALAFGNSLWMALGNKTYTRPLP